MPQSRQSAKLFLKSSELGLPLPLNAKAGVPSPLRFCVEGQGHTRCRERGWESPNSDEGTHTVVLFISTYFVVHAIAIVFVTHATPSSYPSSASMKNTTVVFSVGRTGRAMTRRETGCIIRGKSLLTLLTTPGL
jgi:hypothetical protein